MSPKDTPDEVTETPTSTSIPFDPQPTDTQTSSDAAPDDATSDTTEEAATDDTDEAPAPSTVHLNAPAGFTEEDAKAGAEEYGEFFIGMWGEKPNYGCPYCYFSTLDGSGDVELHILSKIDSGDIVHRAFIPLPEGA